MSPAVAVGTLLLDVARDAHGRALRAAQDYGLRAQDVDAFHRLTNECVRWREEGDRLLTPGRSHDEAEQAICVLSQALQKARDAHRLAMESAAALAVSGLEDVASQEARAAAEAEAHGRAAFTASVSVATGAGAEGAP